MFASLGRDIARSSAEPPPEAVDHDEGDPPPEGSGHIAIWLEICRSLFKNKVQVEELKLITGCSGIEAPVHVLKMMDVRVVLLFSSEPDSMARKFIEQTDMRGEHAFTNITVAIDGVGHCLEHHRTCSFPIGPRAHLFVVGIPCQNFSDANSKRWKRSSSEIARIPSLKTVDTCVAGVIAILNTAEPFLMLFENVCGMQKGPSKRHHPEIAEEELSSPFGIIEQKIASKAN